MRRIGDHFEQTQYGRMGWLVEMRYPLVHAIDGERVLNQVVGSNTEKIDFARKHVSGNSSTWDFDHRTDFGFFANIDLRGVQIASTIIQDRIRATQFIQTGDHWKHDFHIADGAGAKNGA